MSKMKTIVNGLIDNLLDTTLRLKQLLIKDDPDPNEWLLILDERERIIYALKDYEITMSDLNHEQQASFLQIHEMNNNILTLIENQKQVVQKQINNLQRGRLAMQTYIDDGPSGYGAFFDRKN